MEWNSLFHIVGAVLIIWTCSGIGIMISNHYTVMTEELENLLKSSCIIRGEIKYAISELSEVFINASAKTGGSISAWLYELGCEMEKSNDKSFDDIWKEKISYLSKTGNLNKKQLDMATNLGQILGYLDVESQINGLMIWEDNVRFEYENMRDRLSQIKKLSTMLGFCAGVIIVIILI